MEQAKFANFVQVFVTADIEKTVRFYHDLLGFRVVPHYEQTEKFAALYRDKVEILLVQAKFGTVRANRDAFGAGFDAYIVPETTDQVRAFYEEIKARGVTILQDWQITPYGSSEFAFQDCDGRIIGIGRIKEKEVFFANGKGK
jgi:catechol 2,3-dioxygenase-like lactoylglutathione lyase family enzyme